MIRRGMREYRKCASASALVVEGAIAAAATTETSLEDTVLRAEPLAPAHGNMLGAEQISRITRSAPMHSVRSRGIESFTGDELRTIAGAIASETNVGADGIFQLLQRVAARARERHKALEFFQDHGELPETLCAAALYGLTNEYGDDSRPASRSVARHTVVALRALQRGVDPSVRDLECEIAAAYAVLLAPVSMRSAARRAAASATGAAGSCGRCPASCARS